MSYGTKLAYRTKKLAKMARHLSGIIKRFSRCRIALKSTLESLHVIYILSFLFSRRESTIANPLDRLDLASLWLYFPLFYYYVYLTINHRGKAPRIVAGFFPADR